MTQTPSDSSINARLQRIEQRLDEMQRRTMSNLSVTTDAGVKVLEIQADSATIRTPAGDALLVTATLPQWGFREPWAPITAFPTSAFSSSSDSPDPAVYSTMSTARFKPTSAKLLGGTLAYRLSSAPTATCEFRVQYRINGGSLIDIAASHGSTTSGTAVQFTWEYIFPVDVYDDDITLEFQARLAGPFDPLLDAAFFSPFRLYGVGV